MKILINLDERLQLESLLRALRDQYNQEYKKAIDAKTRADFINSRANALESVLNKFLKKGQA